MLLDELVEVKHNNMLNVLVENTQLSMNIDIITESFIVEEGANNGNIIHKAIEFITKIFDKFLNWFKERLSKLRKRSEKLFNKNYYDFDPHEKWTFDVNDIEWGKNLFYELAPKLIDIYRNDLELVFDELSNTLKEYVSSDSKSTTDCCDNFNKSINTHQIDQINELNRLIKKYFNIDSMFTIDEQHFGRFIYNGYAFSSIVKSKWPVTTITGTHDELCKLYDREIDVHDHIRSDTYKYMDNAKKLTESYKNKLISLLKQYETHEIDKGIIHTLTTSETTFMNRFNRMYDVIKIIDNSVLEITRQISDAWTSCNKGEKDFSFQAQAKRKEESGE